MKLVTITMLGLWALAACATTSISDPHGENPEYRGELQELDVIGIPLGADPSDALIRASLEQAEPPALEKGDRIMLIQSGAITPDAPLVSALSDHYRVTPFSGIPKRHGPEYSSLLRLVAARGGVGTIVCCWGLLESATTDYATKAVSWVPIVGGALPDERKDMRMRLRFVLLDVRTGAWTSVATEPVTGSEVSQKYGRKASDVRLVERLKEEGYARAGAEFAAVTAP